VGGPRVRRGSCEMNDYKRRKDRYTYGVALLSMRTKLTSHTQRKA
jgi:hypothetical protein